MHAKQVYYSGHVQGVGFRYTVKRIASGYEVTGWVKNLPDGRVELQAMAQDSQELEDFLEAVRTSSLSGNIRDEEVKELPPLAGVRGFSIAH